MRRTTPRTDPDQSNSGGYLGDRRRRRPARRVWPTPVRGLPARGRVDSTRDPTRVRTLPTSGSTRTANSQRRSRMDRNMTRGYPTSYPSHPRHSAFEQVLPACALFGAGESITSR